MKIGVITIIDELNYGNRLQNYAVQKYLQDNNFEVQTINNINNIKPKLKIKLTARVRNIFRKLKLKSERYIFRKNIENRKNMFKKFNDKYINKTDFIITPTNVDNKLNEQYDFFVIGSDQVWNPFWRLTKIDLLEFADENKRVAFSASFGVNQIPDEKKKEVSEELKKFKNISVREDKGKEIVQKLTGREDVEVLIDPTMLLTKEQWENVIERPKHLKNKKYILNYFLGDIPNKIERKINKIAKEYNCEIINILDKKSDYFETGPSEFLYLEKNAFLICTDSFHSCVFAILFDRPFIVFDRENSIANMNSRTETLLKKFNLQDKKYKGNITKDDLKHDYSKSYEILEKERDKSLNFIKKALSES